MIVCDGVSLALGPIVSAVSLIKRAEGPLSESAPIGRQVAVRAHAALLFLSAMPYLQQYEILCFYDHKHAREGLAQRARQGRRREPQRHARASQAFECMHVHRGAGPKLRYPTVPFFVFATS